jgi:hypothetical protein
MISLEDLIVVKEQNTKVIEENNAIIYEKEKANKELEAENRVFDKLIAMEQEKGIEENQTPCENQ